MKASTDTAFKDYVRDMKRRGIKVAVARQGDELIITRQVPEAKRRAAFDTLLRQLKKTKPPRAGGLTASALVRQMRDSGRY